MITMKHKNDRFPLVGIYALRGAAYFAGQRVLAFYFLLKC